MTFREVFPSPSTCHSKGSQSGGRTERQFSGKERVWANHYLVNPNWNSKSYLCFGEDWEIWQEMTSKHKSDVFSIVSRGSHHPLSPILPTPTCWLSIKAFWILFLLRTIPFPIVKLDVTYLFKEMTQKRCVYPHTKALSKDPLLQQCHDAAKGFQILTHRVSVSAQQTWPNPKDGGSR